MAKKKAMRRKPRPDQYGPVYDPALAGKGGKRRARSDRGKKRAPSISSLRKKLVKISRIARG